MYETQIKSLTRLLVIILQSSSVPQHVTASYNANGSGTRPRSNSFQFSSADKFYCNAPGCEQTAV